MRPGQSAEASAESDQVMAAAALRAERIIAGCRAVFCVIVAVRFVIVNAQLGLPLATARTAVTLPTLFFGVGFSVWLLVVVPRRGRPPRWLYAAGAAVDVTVCFFSLLPNVLWPGLGAGYAGFLNTADATVLILTPFIVGYRVYPGAVGLGAGLNALALAVLVAVDFAHNRAELEYGAAEVTLFALFVATSSILAVLVARRTRHLVASGAIASVRSLRAQASLANLLHTHHDLRSTLSSASLTADLLSRQAAVRPDPELVAGLRNDLSLLRASFASAAEGAYGGLAALEGREAAPLGRAIDAAIAAARARFGGVEIVRADPPDANAAVAVIGGTRTLARLLAHLIANACEGDGQRHARRVTIATAARGDACEISISDDGPGFPAFVLAAETSACLSSKERGSGLGLFLAESLLRFSGGRLERRNHPEGGAIAVMTLPASRPELG